MCVDIRGRQRGSAVGELADERPKPLPRQKRLQDDDDGKRPVPASRASLSPLDRRTPTTPTNPDQRRTPVDQRKSPANERDVFGSQHKTDEHDLGFRYGQSRHSPLDRQDFADRTSPHLDVVRKSPLDRREFDKDRESFKRYSASRKSPSERQSSTDRKSPLEEWKNPDQRRTPVDQHRSPADERDVFGSQHKTDENYLGFRYGKSRRSPLDRQDFIDQTSPHLDMIRKSPLDRREFEEDRESFERYGASCKSPSERRSTTDRKSPLEERQPSSVSSRKSPSESSKFSKSSRQTPPADDRKTPTSDWRKSPVSDKWKKDRSPVTQRKGSVVDFLTESADVRENERLDEERKHRTGRESTNPHQHRRKSTSQSLKRSESIEESPDPFENIRRSPSAISRESKQNRSADNVHTKSTRRSSQVNF